MNADRPDQPVTVVVGPYTYTQRELGYWCIWSTLQERWIHEPSQHLIDRIAALEAELVAAKANELTPLGAKHRLEDEITRLQAAALVASQPELAARLEAIEDAKRVSPDLMHKRVGI